MIIRSVTLFLLVACSSAEMLATTLAAGPWCYRVWFSDKGNVSVTDFQPEDLLSLKAIARREKCGVDPLTYTDLPVSREYIEAVKSTGLTFLYLSKWMNTALFTAEEAFDTGKLSALGFVSRVEAVKTEVKASLSEKDKRDFISESSDAAVFSPVEAVNGMPLSLSGFTGKGITIAVCDGGFRNADLIESLAHLRARGGITVTRDFVGGGTMVYGYDNHGTAVLSILAGMIPDAITGTASGADYMLFRTEDVTSEFPVEEDYWIAAAEYADSAGADIITSSLGYYTFDDAAMDYTFDDADGNTAFITRAADIAASKGLLVVSSAGNERNKEWIRIIFPSDGDSVMCIGAVRQDLTISDFSSAGPSADRRIKPDVVAPGVGIPLQTVPGSWQTGNGTSFSCPVVSGMCASLMQAVPAATAGEIRDAVKRSSNRYNNPDSLYGYGLPDFTLALKKLDDVHTFRPEEQTAAGPNPFFDYICLWFHEAPGSLDISVTDNSGRVIMRKTFASYPARSYTLTELSGISQGVYIVKVTTDEGRRVFKMIKLKR